MVALAKNHPNKMIIGTILPDACITGHCVQVWQYKPSTGHDKEDNSSKANNLEKLATSTLRNSKRVVNKNESS